MKKAFPRVKEACSFRGVPPIACAMPRKDDDRARRLAEALRENLKRRKAQARQAVEEPTTPSPEPPAPTRRQP